jgi:hypothetical protein
MSNSHQRSIQYLDKTTLRKVSSLWALDEDPELHDEKSNDLYGYLVKCHESGELKAYTGKDGKLWTKLSDLQEWARKNGDTPEFLLPEFNPDDTPPIDEELKKICTELPGLLNDRFKRLEDANNKKVKNLSEEKMLALILGMAIDAYGYDPGPQANRNLASGEKKGSISDALDKCGLKVDSDTIRKYLTEAKSLYPDAKRRKS